MPNAKSISIICLSVALGLTGIQLYRYRAELLKRRVSTEGQGATHFVGTFPMNMPSIIQLVSATHFRLLILTDYCAYGQFSNPQAFQNYEAALRQLHGKGARIEMHIYDEKTADLMTASQFALDKPNEADAGFQVLKVSDQWKQYFDFHKNDHLNEPQNIGEFLALMRQQQASCVTQLRLSGVDVRPDVSSELPLFMWLRDNEEAIFSVYNFGHDSREVSLETTDSNLMNLLSDIATRR